MLVRRPRRLRHQGLRIIDTLSLRICSPGHVCSLAQLRLLLSTPRCFILKTLRGGLLPRLLFSLTRLFGFKQRGLSSCVVFFFNSAARGSGGIRFDSSLAGRLFL
jgi:hypothetical protein